MGHHQLASVKNAMADQTVEKACGSRPELGGFRLELLRQFRQSVRALHVTPSQSAHELDVMKDFTKAYSQKKWQRFPFRATDIETDKINQINLVE